MDDVVDDLVRIAERLEHAAQGFDSEEIQNSNQRLIAAVDTLSNAWSGSWIGYQSRVYTKGLRRRQPGEFFDSMWGPGYPGDTGGDWIEYTAEALVNHLFVLAALEPNYLYAEAQAAEKVFKSAKAEVITTLQALLAHGDDKILSEALEATKKLESHVSAQSFITDVAPKHIQSSDSRAIQGARQCPPHLSVQATFLERMSYGKFAAKLADDIKTIVMYLQKVRKLKGATVAKRGGSIFIGNGGKSRAWEELAKLLEKRMGQKVEEYNSAATAGLTHKERLMALLDKCTFAFLVMTAEDETKDGEIRARQNVIHEIGLFQGRYSWMRAIILLEDGCEPFSNIDGLDYIKFPKDGIKSVTEDIRTVLEREGLL